MRGRGVRMRWQGWEWGITDYQTSRRTLPEYSSSHCSACNRCKLSLEATILAKGRVAAKPPTQFLRSPRRPSSTRPPEKTSPREHLALHVPATCSAAAWEDLQEESRQERRERWTMPWRQMETMWVPSPCHSLFSSPSLLQGTRRAEGCPGSFVKLSLCVICTFPTFCGSCPSGVIGRCDITVHKTDERD